MPDSQPQPQQPRRPPAGEGGVPEAAALVLCGARLADGRTVDVRLSRGRIEAVGTAGSLTSPGARVDLAGYLLLPAPAEPHAHCDTALTADLGGPLSYAPEDIQRRTTEAALLHLGHGSTALRTHVRIGGVHGLRSLEAVLQARRALHGLADLAAVAVPRVLTGTAGADGLAMLRDAVAAGATVIGGCPDLDPDPTGHVEAVLAIAAEHGCAVDLHTDGADPARLARLAAMSGGLRQGVSIGPCGGLARLPHEVAARTADQLAAAGVTVVCLPQGDCGELTEQPPASAQGAPSGPSSQDVPDVPAVPAAPGSQAPHTAYTAPTTAHTAHTARGAHMGSQGQLCAPVRLLRAAGVPVAAGSGALRDTANPVGRGDPLEAAFLLASRGELRPAEAYDAVCGRARAAMGLPEVRVEAGFPAELLAVRGEGIAAVLSLAYSRIVVHQGRVVARTSAVREYCDSAVAVALDLPRQLRSNGGGGRDQGY
ncbi:hydrolase [Streptomyces palmae]|uniref:hydrolase n=1 Tax=Streptomyces palmae TaxID=1701085 RepID=UPI001FD7CE94|nr:hydrolase [Streptomyces palmae]